jgi:hypothetical protein
MTRPSHWTFWALGPGLVGALLVSDATDTPSPALTYLLILLAAAAVSPWWSDRRWNRWVASGRIGPPPD